MVEVKMLSAIDGVIKLLVYIFGWISGKVIRNAEDAKKVLDESKKYEDSVKASGDLRKVDQELDIKIDGEYDKRFGGSNETHN